MLSGAPMSSPTYGIKTENGKFFEAAKQFKEGLRPPESVKVYEKIKSGIWAFAGTFSLIDASPKQSGGRKVFKFKLMLVDLMPHSQLIQTRSHMRFNYLIIE